MLFLPNREAKYFSLRGWTETGQKLDGDWTARVICPSGKITRGDLQK